MVVTVSFSLFLSIELKQKYVLTFPKETWKNDFWKEKYYNRWISVEIVSEIIQRQSNKKSMKNLPYTNSSKNFIIKIIIIVINNCLPH
jgi:hypothetical protein